MKKWTMAFLAAATGLGVALAAAETAPTAPAVKQDPEVDLNGYAPPKKGPLISKTEEDLVEDLPGPETVIRLFEDEYGNKVREFVLNGALFQIEVIPFKGRPYYLVDNDGDGLFESRYQGYEPKLIVPQWVVFHW